MLKDLFHKKRYATINVEKEEKNRESITIPQPKKKEVKKEASIDDEVWIKCKKCGEILLRKDVEKSLKTCHKCDYHFRFNAKDRLKEVLDENSFIEFDKGLQTANPLDFPNYEDKINKAKTKSELLEGVITGEGKIKDNPCIICVMDPNFMMGSMGSVVGEKITRAIENAMERKLPVIIFSASGGARMQEGMLSLMQMAKTSAALKRLSDEGLLYVSVLTDPTTGGVTASFAMLGDIIISEPGALIGFAGPRVIEQTIRKKLPKGFQRSEFLKDKGFIDKIVHRKNMRKFLANILHIHALGGEKNE